jgi:hypothetical protein
MPLPGEASKTAAEVRANALRMVAENPQGLLAEYARRFLNVLNADDAAELFPDYAQSRESRAQFRVAVHPAAQWVRDELFKYALAAPDVKEVVFTAGGNGAGKSVGKPEAGVVMDTTLSDLVHSERLIQSDM